MRFAIELVDALFIIVVVIALLSLSGALERSIGVTAIIFGVSSTIAVRKLYWKKPTWDGSARAAVVLAVITGLLMLVVVGFLFSAGVDRLSVLVGSVVIGLVMINWAAIAMGYRGLRANGKVSEL